MGEIASPIIPPETARTILSVMIWVKTSRFVAHDEENTCNEGDTVRIMETRPLSKSKNWRLVEIIERAK